MARPDARRAPNPPIILRTPPRLAAGLSNGLSVSEVVFSRPTSFRLSNSVQISDVAVPNVAKVRSRSDSITISETVTPRIKPTVTKSNALLISETVTKGVHVKRTVPNTIAYTEVVSKRTSKVRTLFDSIQISDAVARRLAVHEVVPNAVTISETISVARALFRSLSDSALIDESVTATVTFTAGGIDITQSVDNSIEIDALVGSIVTLTLRDVQLFNDDEIDALVFTSVPSRTVSLDNSVLISDVAVATLKRRTRRKGPKGRMSPRITRRGSE